ncbi:MAG: hypothetical protein U0U09_05895 [Cyclobacteriaceae bacterium]
MKRFLTPALLIVSIVAYAQGFKATGKLETPAQDGFYKILLSPQQAQYINPAFANIRVIDSKKTEVPYILREEQPEYVRQQFKEYEMLENKQVKGAYTSIKLHNPTQASINNISLLIKNAEVSKSARLSGSDDGKSWFAVKENFALSYINNPSAANELRGIEFPLTNYKYYLLEISDSTTSPINILKAGYYDAATTQGLYSEITGSFTLATETRNKQTFLKLAFGSPQIIDKLELSMKGAPFFQRFGVVTTTESRKVKKHIETYERVLAEFVIRSGQTTVINLNTIKATNLTLRIENDDNPALSVNELHSYQLNRYLVAWLTKNESYTVGFGAENLSSPSYDLTYFRDSIPANPQVISVNDVKPVEPAAVSTDTQFFNSKTLTWIAIGAVILLLGIMSLRLVRETNASQNRES